MANGNAIIISSATIDGTSYDLIDSENITIGNEEGESSVDDGQTVVNWYDQSFEFRTYDLGVLSGTNVGTDSTIPSEISVSLVSDGGSTYTISNARCYAHRKFDADREYALVKIAKRSTSQITVA